MIKISVVIPCYNHGRFLLEAISSVEECTNKSIYEIIIVNDGSTEEATIAIINGLQDKYLVINQNNQGLSAARNNGIKRARGKYILPLDSDNKIKPEYITKSIEILDNKIDVAVVYGNSLFFGEKNRINIVPNFDLESMFIQNTIDACAVFRKSVWEEVGGYDEEMILGYEDWFFWLNIGITYWKFCHINDVMFEYRVRHDSMVHTTKKKENHEFLLDYMTTKLIRSFRSEYRQLYFQKNKLNKEIIEIKQSYSYRIGNFLIKPLSLIKRILKRIF